MKLGPAPKGLTIYNTYSVWFLADLLAVFGTIGLGLTYAVARHYNHVGTFCDISDLVVHMPERVLFRLNFSLVGSTLFILSFPIHDLAVHRLGHPCLARVGVVSQALSGLGVILVGGCGPEENMPMHALAAVLGFGGSFVAQAVYGYLFCHEVSPSPASKILYLVRCCLSVAFLVCAVLYGLDHAGIFHEPVGHVSEWGMWFSLLAWYCTFRFDMQSLKVVTADAAEEDHKGLLLECHDAKLAV